MVFNRSEAPLGSHLESPIQNVNAFELEQVSGPAKNYVLSALNGKRLSPLLNLEKEQHELKHILEETIVSREGNSCMLLGARSTGKTVLVETVISQLQKQYGKDSFLTVKLSGYAQPEDKMAIREICRQLDVEVVKISGGADETELLEKKSINDTLMALIEVLEQEEDYEDEDEEDHDQGDIANNSSVRPKSSALPIVFILDEVDRFIMNSRQTLLYNLLDVTQSTKVGMAVIGITANMNSREMMEKRVRSRFSQRMYLIKRPTSLETFWKVCRNNIVLHDDFINGEFAEVWNAHIDQMYTLQDSPLAFLVEQIYYTTKDSRLFNTKLLYAVSNADPLPALDDITAYSSLQTIADTESFLDGLSELELALLICAARTEVKFDKEAINFNIAYDEYLDLAKQENHRRSSLISSSNGLAGYRIWSKEIARSSWERLIATDLILVINSYMSSKKIVALGDELKMVNVDVSLLELSQFLGRSHPLYAWTRL